MSRPLLSICVPTYNFGPYIGETLESLARQATEDVEVVIVDGASTDDTPAVVAKYAARFPRLSYVPLDRKGGIDHDIEVAIEQAKGVYCWIFSADDTMDDGAIASVLERLPAGDDVILIETMLCAIDMSPLRRHRNLNLDVERVFELSDRQQRHEYFALAANTQAFFSFCGGFVFRRDRWMSSDWDRSFIGSCWAHVARLFALTPNGLRVRHVPGVMTKKRQGNDSFAADGLARRVAIGIDGYLCLGEALFGADSEETRHIRRTLRAEYDLLTMAGIKLAVLREGTDADVELLNALFSRIYPVLVGAAYRWPPHFVWRLLGHLRPGLKRLTRR